LLLHRVAFDGVISMNPGFQNGEATMATEHSFQQEQSRRTLIIVVAVVAALLIGGLFYFLMRKTVGEGQPPRLEGAIRAGSPDFEKYRGQIALDNPEAIQAKRALGDWVMTLQTTARNFTGKTITGLEIWAAVVDHDGHPVRERTVVVIPSPIPGRPTELEPNKTLPVSVVLDRMTDEDDRANIKMEVRAFKFK